MKKIKLYIITTILLCTITNTYATNNTTYTDKIKDFITKIEEKNKTENSRIEQLEKINKQLKKLEKNRENKGKIDIFIKMLENKIQEYQNNIELINFKRIAHAGGIYNGEIKTNSIEALEENKNNYSLFEIDLSWTKDNKLVCVHDWRGSFYENFGFKLDGNIPTYNEFNNYAENNPKYQNCNLETLIEWLEKNPSKYIITDIKENNIKGLEYIASQHPSLTNRFIPQIYTPTNYNEAKKIGYQKIIWTLYKYWRSDTSVLEYAKNMELYAITMPTERAYSGLGEKLKELNFYTYTHTVNRQEELEEVKKLGIDEIYTDTLEKRQN